VCSSDPAPKWRKLLPRVVHAATFSLALRFASSCTWLAAAGATGSILGPKVSTLACQAMHLIMRNSVRNWAKTHAKAGLLAGKQMHSLVLPAEGSCCSTRSALLSRCCCGTRLSYNRRPWRGHTDKEFYKGPCCGTV